MASARSNCERRPDLAEGIGERFPPLRFDGGARVGAGEAAQQTLRRRPRQRIGRSRGAQAVGIGDRGDRIEHGGFARQAGEIRLVAELAAEDRAVDHVAVVDDRMDHRNILLVTGEAQIIDRAGVKETAVADAGQIELRDRLRRQVQERSERILVLCQPVVREEVVIRQQNAVPTPGPFVVQRELALGVDAAAELTVAGLAGECARVELVDAVGADLVRTVEQTLAEFTLQQHALLGREARTEGRVIIRREREIIGRFDPVAVGRIRGVGRHQEAALALHGRVGRREKRQVGHRNAEEFELRVLEIEHLLGFIVDDARALDLPQRRLLRIVLAGRAGGVNAVLEHGVIAAGAVGAGRGHPRRIFGIDTQRIDETVAVVVAEIHDVGVGDLTFRVGEADIALGMQALGLLVVDDLVSLDAGAVIEHLHVADRRHALIVVVVIDLGGLHEHLAVVLGRRRRRPWADVDCR